MYILFSFISIYIGYAVILYYTLEQVWNFTISKNIDVVAKYY